MKKNGFEECTYNYFRSFLSSLIFTLHFAKNSFMPPKLGSLAAQKGSVLSPFLFNLAMRERPAFLSDIPITASLFLCRRHHPVDGSRLLRPYPGSLATDHPTIEEDTAVRGGSCYLQKPALFVDKPHYQHQPMLKATTSSGASIPGVHSIKVLGLRNANCRYTDALRETEKRAINHPAQFKGSDEAQGQQGRQPH